MSIPTLTVLIGLPASGKSAYANELKQLKPNTVILSSDSIRKQLFGDETDQSDNNKVFNHLYMIMQSHLLTFNDVIIDATNINRKSRKRIFERLGNIPCRVNAVVFATPYNECLARNKARERQVPEHVIQKMYYSFEFPQKFEGFDEIEVKTRLEDKQNLHPTVKPIALMRYLCRLITPPNGTVLDAYMGSGSTGIACKLEGFNFIGIEREEDYFKIASERIENFKGNKNE